MKIKREILLLITLVIPTTLALTSSRNENESDVQTDIEQAEISGSVRDPNGKRVAGAQVALSTENIGVLISNGKLETMRTGTDSRIVQTDSQGQFDLGQGPAANFDLIIAHNSGFALVEFKDSTASYDIQLQRWGRIEGQLARGRNAEGNKISMSGLPNSTWFINKRDYSYQTECDENGRFIFDKVPPGWFEVGYLVRTSTSFWSLTCRTSVELKAGDTTNMTLGGTGRPVIGKFVSPEGYNIQIPFEAGVRALYTVLPEQPRPENYHQMTRQQQQQWLKQWRNTQEYRQYIDSAYHNENWRHYTFYINEDGSFRIEDVIPGKYELYVILEEEKFGQGFTERIEVGGYSGEIEVQKMTEVYNDEPLDLGILDLDVYNKEAYIPSLIGKALPSIEEFNIELSHSDTKNKMLLLCFFDYQQRPSRNTVLQLAQQAEDLHAKNIAVVLIQASRINQNTLNEWIEENDISFPVGMIATDEEQTKFVWGVQSLPWLILTDAGHIVTDEGFSTNELNERIVKLTEK